MRNELTGHEWGAIKPMPPNKPRNVPRMNDRRVLDGIFRFAIWRTVMQSTPLHLALVADRAQVLVDAEYDQDKFGRDAREQDADHHAE